MRIAEELLLLLCCRLGRTDVQPLTAREYRILSTRLSGLTQTKLTEQAIASCGFPIDFSRRVVRLLSSPEAAAHYLSLPDMTVLTRLSDAFPTALQKLGNACPPALFLRGDASLLASPCIALTGSRRLRQPNRRFAERIGTLAAAEGFTLVSGGAIGADQAAQNACLRAGGRVICFVPDALSSHPPQKNVLFCADEGHDLPFSVPRALRRNCYIHALGGRAFVAQSTFGRGGSRQGALDGLRLGLSSVFVYDDGSDGAQELIACGAVGLSDLPVTLRDLQQPQLSIFDGI